MHGKNRIGFDLSDSKTTTISAYNPSNDLALAGNFYTANDADIELTLNKSSEAFKSYKSVSGKKKADFLDAIGEEIIALGDQLIHRAMAETALPEGRIIGERGRTVGQLKLFASLLREGSWVEASIDKAMPDREPVPKPDIRKMLIPIGPVVIFTASNFPLAFSTAGGDTASALAAGNPVIIKAHESHLGTNELVADAISNAAKRTSMPDGVFSSLVGSGFELGQKLVKHPKTKSVAFTGSYRGGKALFDLANKRDEPIPVFAEMGSINPVFILPGKMKLEANSLAKTYAGSITMGVGQFCTNPGLLIAVKTDDLDKFIDTIGSEISGMGASTMLNKGIAKAYSKGIDLALTQKGVNSLSVKEDNSEENTGNPTIASISATEFINNPALQHEVFGPFSLLIICDDINQMDQVIDTLQGQLTVTFMGTDDDLNKFSSTIKKSTEITGRLIFNGVPTGVEVCHSMQHGGPFPASTDGRFTSVGADAIKRFVRPLSFQNTPNHLLPDELKDDNPINIWRKIDGALSK